MRIHTLDSFKNQSKAGKRPPWTFPDFQHYHFTRYGSYDYRAIHFSLDSSIIYVEATRCMPYTETRTFSWTIYYLVISFTGNAKLHVPICRSLRHTKPEDFQQFYNSWNLALNPRNFRKGSNFTTTWNTPAFAQKRQTPELSQLARLGKHRSPDSVRITCSRLSSRRKSCNKYPWVMLLHNIRHMTLHIITAKKPPHRAKFVLDRPPRETRVFFGISVFFFSNIRSQPTERWIIGIEARTKQTTAGGLLRSRAAAGTQPPASQAQHPWWTNKRAPRGFLCAWNSAVLAPRANNLLSATLASSLLLLIGPFRKNYKEITAYSVFFPKPRDFFVP